MAKRGERKITVFTKCDCGHRSHGGPYCQAEAETSVTTARGTFQVCHRCAALNHLPDAKEAK